MTEDRQRERLRFRSWHRGTREMDLLLGSFADAHLSIFNAQQLAAYEELLLQNDPDLYNWITGKEVIPTEQKNDVLQLLCAHQFAKQQEA